MEVVRIGRTASAAVEPGIAVPALFLGIDIAELELVPHRRIHDALIHIAQLEVLQARELMAGVNVSVRRNGKILCSGTAAGQTLGHAGSLAQVKHKVEEGKASALFLPLNIFLCQKVILLQNHRQILLPDGVGCLIRRHHRLHGKLCKAQVGVVQHICGKIRIIACEGSPDEVVLISPLLLEVSELRDDDIVAALSVPGRAHPVIHFFSAVQAEHHIAHLPVAEIDDLIIQKHSVGGDGKAEMLVLLLFQRTAVGHQLLHNLPVHQRFPAEEIHLQVSAVSGVGHQEVQRFLSRLQAHESALPVVLALSGKAIAAGQVAVVGHMKTEGLDYGLPLLEIHDKLPVDIRRKQFSSVDELLGVIQAVPDLFCRVLSGQRRFRLLPELL